MARILIGNIKGPKGDTGARGATGPQGATGPTGPMPPLTNNALATTPGVSALDAVMGKTLDDKIGKVNSDFTEYCKGYITDNANINALGDGVYYYNGWGSSTMTGTPPFSNDYGIWIRRTPYDSVGSTGTDIVIRNNGAIYSRKLISEGTWGPWIISDLSGKADISMLPKTVHTSITGTGSDYYDISCPGIKYGAAVIVQFASQRNEYYILNADAMADNTVRIRVNKAVPAGTGIYVNAIYSVN